MSVGFFHSRELENGIGGLLRDQAFDAAISYCSSMAPYLKDFGGPRVLDLVDVDSEKWRQYAGRSPLPKRAIYSLEHRHPFPVREQRRQPLGRERTKHDEVHDTERLVPASAEEVRQALAAVEVKGKEAA